MVVFAFVFCGFIALGSAGVLLWYYRALSAFDGTLSTLPKEIPDSDPFDRDSKLGRAANEYVSLFSTAAARNALSAFRIEDASAPLQAHLRSRASTPRSLVGVLILVGLLVTLFNLQGSVAILGSTFIRLAGRPPAAQSDPYVDTQQIQLAMGAIAETAHKAFLTSGAVILSATVVLLLSLLLQRRGQHSMRQFRSWAQGAYLETVAQRPVDQQAQLKFAELIEKMGTVVGSFETIGNAMATAGDLGMKLEGSSQMVAQAVAQLPASINASVVQLTADVTKDLAAHMEHQTEHIKKIFAIYGDTGAAVRKMQEYLDGHLKSMTYMAETVAGLKTVPEKLEMLASSIERAASSSARVVEAAENLSAKIDQLPLDEIRWVLVEIQSIRSEMPAAIWRQAEPALKKLEETVASVNDKTSALGEIRTIKSIVDSLPKSAKIEEVLDRIRRMEDLVQGLGERRGWFDRILGRGAGA